MFAKIEFKNEQVNQVPFKLQNYDGKWSVAIRRGLPCQSEFKWHMS
ncbi:hypothetical protein [Clostridium estertheticum]|nr:hypothetical protein [Clostridium estertheticum]